MNFALNEILTRMNMDSRRAGVRVATVLLFVVCTACATQPPRPPQPPPVPAAYAALPDSIICIVDRTNPSGLRQISGKKRGDDVVVLVDGEVKTLEEAHPVSLIAGYAGREPWLTRGEQIPFEQRQFVRTGGERRIAADMLKRVGEHQGILLFAGRTDDSPVDALYVPTAPACIFQAYVRQDLLRQ
jgi:hypothetical protein